MISFTKQVNLCTTHHRRCDFWSDSFLGWCHWNLISVGPICWFCIVSITAYRDMAFRGECCQQMSDNEGIVTLQRAPIVSHQRTPAVWMGWKETQHQSWLELWRPLVHSARVWHTRADGDTRQGLPGSPCPLAINTARWATLLPLEILTPAWRCYCQTP